MVDGNVYVNSVAQPGIDSTCVFETPSFFGSLTDLTKIAEAAHENGALLIAVFPEVVSLGAVTPPG